MVKQGRSSSFDSEKCLFGVYIAAAATSTALFLTTLVVIIQLKDVANENAEIGLMCGMGVAYPGREVPDDNITASSDYNANHGSRFGRLNMPSTGSNSGGWSARNKRIGEWIGVDFGMVKKIRGVMTQGRSDYDQWVTSYKISCSNATGNTNIILGDKVYKGNFDRDTIVTNLLSPSKSCRYVRIYPQTWAAHMSLRMEWLTTCP